MARKDPTRRSSALVRYRGGLLSGLPRRALLTLQYHGPGEIARRGLSLPLRVVSPSLDRRLRERRAYGAEVKAAAKWYRSEGKPVTVVIPTYGDPQLVIDAVASIRQTTERSKVRIIVSDDGSDAEVQRRLSELKDAEVILGDSQQGFAANVNRAMRLAESDVVLLNSDIIARKGWLERLQFAAYEEDARGIIGARLLYGDRRIQFAGIHRNLGAPEWFDHRFRFAPSDHGPAQISGEVLAVTGACMYIKKELIDQIGLLDEGYPMAYEDVDYSLRAWEAGWQCLYYPAAELTHLESVSRGSVQNEREIASQEYFWNTWGAWFKRDVTSPDGKLRVIYVTEDTGVGGGHRDIFEHINRLRARGHDAQLYSLGGQPEWFDLDVTVRSFETYDELAAALEPEKAIKIATWWSTAPSVWLASVRNGLPVDFVQDVETSYYPDSAEMRNAVLASYRNEFQYMTISGWNRDGLRKLGVEPTLVPPGIDLETFRPLDGISRREDMLLALGRTNPLKNLTLTLDAWKALGPARPELCLFGIEPELGHQHGTRYVERPSDQGVNELFNQATVFVQTSSHEGFCLPALEAMATGAAVVCTDAHGNRDFCDDGVNCLMPDASVESVSGAISRLLGDPQLRAKLGEAGIATAADYAWSKRIDELEDFLYTAAERGYAGGPPAAVEDSLAEAA
jgi:GT2 family glycosyltransferase